jgi:hypothetical protein
MKKIFFIFMIFVLAACGGASTEYGKNLSKWNDANINHYRYELSVSCFCPFAEINPLSVEVRDGQIVSMMDATGVEVLDTDPAYASFAPYATVNGLFDWVKPTLEEADKIEVVYDSMYGFPTSIAVDYITEAVDDEIWISVSNFQVLE